MIPILSGIPTKIVNAPIYGWILPVEPSAFFAADASAVAFGTLLYSVVKVAVEGVFGRRWSRTGYPKVNREHGSSGRVSSCIKTVKSRDGLIANCASG